MSKNTTVTVQRSGTNVQTGVIVQIDHKADETAAYQSGQTQYDVYRIYAKWANADIEHNDNLVDEASGGLTYRVSGQPRQYPNGLCVVRAIVKKLT